MSTGSVLEKRTHQKKADLLPTLLLARQAGMQHTYLIVTTFAGINVYQPKIQNQRNKYL